MAQNHDETSLDILRNSSKQLKKYLTSSTTPKDMQEFIAQHQSNLDRFMQKSQQEQKENDEAVTELDKQMKVIIDSLNEPHK